jgi:hypothetical protein
MAGDSITAISAQVIRILPVAQGWAGASDADGRRTTRAQEHVQRGTKMSKFNLPSRAAVGIMASVLSTAITAVAMAAPGFHDQNREASRYADADACTDTAEGYRCARFGANQRFDKEGNFEEADVYLYEEELNSEVYIWRYMSCPVGRSVLAISLPGPEATFAVSVDTENCFNVGMRLDLATGNEESYGFTGTLDLSGRWNEPALRGSSQYTQHEKYNNMQWNYACNTKYGWDYQTVSAVVDGKPWVSAPGFVYSDMCNLLSKEK